MNIKKLRTSANRHFFQPIVSFYWRLANNNYNFTIISNNCWGGGIYQELKMPYLTPTIGLYFYPDDYILLLQNLEYYMKEAKLTFSESSKYVTSPSYPIGLLDDKIEIHFLHYKSEKEAADKWTRRAGKINWNNLFIKMDDRDGCTTEHCQQFDKLPYEKKVLFCAKQLPYASSFYLKSCRQREYVDDLYTHKYLWRKSFNLIKWLNN